MYLRIEGVTKEFETRQGKLTALEETSLEIQAGEFVCFVGPSGCGKTTLLNLVAGLERPTKGRILMNGKEIEGPGGDRVVIFQETALFPWLNVIQNVEFGLVNRMDSSKRRKIAHTFLNLFHLGRFETSYVHELSGGMKSRVALARALALNPSVLLMDEPFAALDAQTRGLLHEEMQDIFLQVRQTVLFVTHNVREAVRLADRVGIFTARPGRIKGWEQIEKPRPRPLIDDLDWPVPYIKRIQPKLREEIEKVLREEVDHDWALKKSDLLRPAGIDLGSGI